MTTHNKALTLHFHIHVACKEEVIESLTGLTFHSQLPFYIWWPIYYWLSPFAQDWFPVSKIFKFPLLAVVTQHWFSHINSHYSELGLSLHCRDCLNSIRWNSSWNIIWPIFVGVQKWFASGSRSSWQQNLRNFRVVVSLLFYFTTKEK